MKNLKTSLIALLFTPLFSFAQLTDDTCANDRFAPDLTTFAFASATSTDITYGTNTSRNIARIYTPVGDANTCRPVVIWAHGGGFTGGNYTDQKETEMMQDLARKGYVA